MIFQGIVESEYEDSKDIKTGIVKAIANTMQGETEEDKTKSAGDTSIASMLKEWVNTTHFEQDQ